MREPRDALAAMAASLPDAQALISALPGPFRRSIRLHPRRGTPSGWDDLTPLSWNPIGHFHASGIDPATRLDYHTGLAYPQDAASQVPVILLDPQPGERVIDVCAAPGSKSTQIGISLGDAGLLLCLDDSAVRRRVLIENLARQGILGSVVSPLPVADLARRHPAWADAVLVDVPCSGHLRRSERQVQAMARRQGRILDEAARLVRPGGRLVYSTCTPYRGEDEDQIGRFLKNHPGWRISPRILPGCDADLDGSGGVRLWPHRQGTEPFFAIRLEAPEDRPGGPAPIGRPLHPSLRIDAPFLDPSLHRWSSGDLALIAGPQAAACTLPAEARGLILGRQTRDGLDLDPWAAQAAIERGAMAITLPHPEACRLWSGEPVSGEAADGTLAKTSLGAPLGRIRRQSGQILLALPSRLRRPSVV